ncbi:helix-turn-helix domain-containing protein [Sneathiella glossodoripedis]|uniref:helix-turn-helix domain-containing protein n=1 Tax=Sneathiella glossodoripedis TaxID=418853 RepID=UPI000470C961|nr:LysR family transcriptional regulator [Sneathiella glossodoripedis]
MDPNLKQYATQKQWEAMVAIHECGSVIAAARKLGIDHSAVSRRRSALLLKAAKHGYAPDHDMTHPVAPGFKIKGTSTLYDKTSGEAKIQWIKTTADEEQREAAFRAFLDEAKSQIERVAPIESPDTQIEHLISTYIVGDHHLGMYAWGEETGAEDHDLQRGEQLLMAAMSNLVERSPDSQQAAILILGDFLHYDSMKSVTPKNKHHLDTANRAGEMVRAGRRVLKYLIECALKKHQHVTVLIEPGNHDEYSALFLREMFVGMYENEPRCTIDPSPRNIHVLLFGANLIATTHNDKLKENAQALILATDFPEEWARSKYRVVHSCHDHHNRIKEVPGVTLEGHQILIPPDAHGAGGPWRSMQSMKAIIYHAEYGEVSRLTVNPAMLAA